MPTPLPAPSAAKLVPPDRDEVVLITRGLTSAVRPEAGLTELQAVLLAAMARSMTGHEVDPTAVEPIEADAFAAGLADRDHAFRERLVQVMELAQMVLTPPDPDVARRVEAFAHELMVDDECIHKARAFAEGSLDLAAIDFDRNRYLQELGCEAARATHASGNSYDLWTAETADPALAARWRGLGELGPDTLGHRVHDFYLARGFAFPGEEGSAPPLLAQHDWCHVLADFGTKVESELEVFGFIARASDDPTAFSLLAMTVQLFETGYLPNAAGIFEADAGHLTTSVAERLADAMRRGAQCDGSVDFLKIDWFDLAELTVAEAREHFGVRPKDERALQAGSVGPWEPGGISPFQVDAGRQLADREGRAYDPHGAAV